MKNQTVEMSADSNILIVAHDLEALNAMFEKQRQGKLRKGARSDAFDDTRNDVSNDTRYDTRYDTRNDTRNDTRYDTHYDTRNDLSYDIRDDAQSLIPQHVFERSDKSDKIEGLDEIGAEFRNRKQRKVRARIDRRKLKAISRASIIIVFLIGIFTNIVYRYIADIGEQADISDRARDQVSSAPAISPPVINNTPELPGQIDEMQIPDIEVPLAPGPRPIMETITNLREEFGNDDIVGYVQVAGTAIDYMVLQSDDNRYYLNRDVYHRTTDAGSIFMDYENDPFDLDSNRNTIIYGHNMRDGTQFHNIRHYRDRQYFDENKYIRLITPHDETLWEIFAFYSTHISFNYIEVAFQNDAHFMALINEINRRSVHSADIEIGPDDQILTLSTCTGADRDTRNVIHAKLINRISAEEIEAQN